MANALDHIREHREKLEASAEEYLVDDGWKAVEVEPEVVNGNGHADNIGPSVE